MLYTEASPGRIAATPTSIPASTRTRCLVCKEPTERESNLHWRHVDGTAECLVFVTDRKDTLRFTRDGKRVTWVGEVHRLAPRVAEKPDVTISRWAGERLLVVPGRILDPVLARVDYLAWASDHPGARPEPKTKMRAAIVAAGGVAKGYATGAKSKTHPLQYHGLAIADGEHPATDPLPALTALRDHGLVTDRESLNRAYRELR